MKTIFMGTPDFAIPTLEYLYENTELLAIFTKQDKVNSRGNKVVFSPVKKFALDKNVNLHQPKSLKNQEIIDLIKEYNPDLIVVVAYGMIIPLDIINLPIKHKIINVHASLLPKYRGASPIHASILNGDDKTGVSIMYIAEKLDAGDIILTLETPINKEDNLQTVYDRLKLLGAKGVKEAIKLMKEDKIVPIKQEDSLATFVKPIKKEETKLDFSKTSFELFNKIRAFNPFPESYAILNGKILKIYDSEIIEYESLEKVGTVIDIRKEGFIVKTKDKALLIKEVKLEGKNKQTAFDFVNGRGIKKYDILL